MYAGLSETIFALASGYGRAALAVLRVSGSGCAEILRALCGDLPVPRRASLRTLRDGDGLILDSALVLWFPGPGSYTGEDSFELHIHGGLAVIDGVEKALAAFGARPAAPGEFTRRAVTLGRMGLLEAEAVADLIDAETEVQRHQALLQLDGALGEIYHDWADRLLRVLAQQEALIDFPDEDLPTEVAVEMRAQIHQLLLEMQMHLKDGERGERLRSGLVFAITGPPNVGKSTLINALCQRDVAIVSPVAGTTRDVLEARLALAGIPVTLLDTAGLRDAQDPVEAEGVRRAKERAGKADLVIALSSQGVPAEISGWPASSRILQVWAKCDIAEADIDADISISARTGSGMAELLTVLEGIARDLAGPGRSPTLSRARHRRGIESATSFLAAALMQELPELVGEELRLAVRALGQVTGHVGTEDVLDSIFGQFCIGK